LDDENDNFIHGFDTFIDQVSQESRAFAIKYSTFRHHLCPHSSSPPWAHFQLAALRITIDINFTKDKLKEKTSEEGRASTAKVSYEDALIDRTLDLKAEHSSSKIKSAVRRAIEG